MNNVIIGIHGLGNKPSEPLLRSWWEQSMTEGLKSGNFNPILPNFEMVFWSDILYEQSLDPNVKNIESPYFIDEKYVKASGDFTIENNSARIKIVDYLGKQMNRIFLNEDLSLNYSFISDAIISRYFKDLEVYYCGNSPGKKGNHCAKKLIRARLHQKLKEHRKDNIMLIGHSMGSVIAYDVLTLLATDININTFITMGSPLGLPVIKSRIAAEQKERGVSVSTVLKTPPGITQKWYNFSDILDKVAFNYKLSDHYSANSHRVYPTDFLTINNYEINGNRNPHKSFGYLRTYEFAKVLNDFIQTEKPAKEIKIIQKILRSIRKKG